MGHNFFVVDALYTVLPCIDIICVFFFSHCVCQLPLVGCLVMCVWNQSMCWWSPLYFFLWPSFPLFIPSYHPHVSFENAFNLDIALCPCHVIAVITHHHPLQNFHFHLMTFILCCNASIMSRVAGRNVSKKQRDPPSTVSSVLWAQRVGRTGAGILGKTVKE